MQGFSFFDAASGELLAIAAYAGPRASVRLSWTTRCLNGGIWAWPHASAADAWATPSLALRAPQTGDVVRVVPPESIPELRWRSPNSDPECGGRPYGGYAGQVENSGIPLILTHWNYECEDDRYWNELFPRTIHSKPHQQIPHSSFVPHADISKANKTKNAFAFLGGTVDLLK